MLEKQPVVENLNKPHRIRQVVPKESRFEKESHRKRAVIKSERAQTEITWRQSYCRGCDNSGQLRAMFMEANSLDVNFEDNLVPFSAYKIKDAQCLWLSNDAPPSFAQRGLMWNARTAIDELAYGIPDTTLFLPEYFDLHDHKSLFAERYGGRNISANGGGVRCGNVQDVQVKGIGKNILAGTTSDYSHTHGGMLLDDALGEIVYTNLLRTLMPCGVAKIYGLLTTPIPTSSYIPFSGVPEFKTGALMLREAALRPAHLMACQDFQPSEQAKRRLLSEGQRLRGVYKQLAQQEQHNTHLIQRVIERFIVQSAKQFAFAKIMRVLHGSCTPSNICLDGRWLDLGTASTLPISGDYLLASCQLPFFSEHFVIREVVDDLLYHIQKYCPQKSFSAAYYQKTIDIQFEHHLIFYAKRVLGLPMVNLTEPAAKQAEIQLTKQVMDWLTRHQEMQFCEPESYHDNAELLAIIEQMFFVDTSETEVFRTLLTHIYRHKINKRISAQHFLTSCFIKAFRECHLSELFFRGWVYGAIKKRDSAAEVIDAFQAHGHWIFGHDDKSETQLFQDQHQSVSFDLLSGAIVLKRHQTGRSQRFALADFSVEELDIAPDAIGYPFRNYLQRLIKGMQRL